MEVYPETLGFPRLARLGLLGIPGNSVQSHKEATKVWLFAGRAQYQFNIWLILFPNVSSVQGEALGSLSC